MAPRTEAKQKLKLQLLQLSEVFNRPMKSNSDYAGVKAAFRKWDEYTLDLLRTLFKNDDIPREFEEIKHTTVKEGLLGDYCQQLRQTADRHWQKLDSLIQRVDLYAEPDDMESTIAGGEPSETSNGPALMKVNGPAQSKDNWRHIENDFDMKKTAFGRRINFITDPFKRTIIFRDVEHAYVLANVGFSKPAVILAGSVIEELLREYLQFKDIQPRSNTFDEYIKACEDKKLLKRGISRLSDSVRYFRNLVHLSNEESKKYTISKATAKSAVASIFSIANDFQ